MREHRLAAALLTLLLCLGTLGLALPVAASAQTQEQLTVTLAGNGTGSVTDSNYDFACPTECTYEFDQGATVQLSASAGDPGQNSTFAGWSGAGCSGTGSCTVTMSQAQDVTATFTLVPPTPQVTLAVTLAGNGTGSVSDSGADFTCPPDCRPSFAQGSLVELTASADAGSTFLGWSGAGCSGSGSCIVTLSQSVTVTATFQVPGHGTVSVPRPRPRRGQVRSLVRLGWRWNATRTTLTRASFSHLPPRGSITLRCAGPHCPFHHHTTTTRHVRAFEHSLTGRNFRPGDTLTLTIAAPHERAERARVTFPLDARPVATLGS